MRLRCGLLLLAGCSPGTPMLDASMGDVVGADATASDASVVPRVTIASGELLGRAGNGFQEFLGIPYAAPPVGALRWKPPQPASSWSEPRNATSTPSRCPQNFLGAPSGREDCLYVNVHAPLPTPSNAPVMVWFHGGGFVLGEGTQIDGGTRGDVLASTRGVVVVSVNYRLGALGFLAHSALTREGNGSSGNYGLLDQRAALQWVRTNIRAFGGNPDNVTIFGESAGGMSVCAHLASPLSAGLFHRAIVQSGPCGLPMSTLAEAEQDGQRLATTLRCSAGDVATCLRAATPEQILTAIPTPPGFFSTDPQYIDWGPNVDGSFFPEPPMQRFRNGMFQRVPTLFGWNRDEGTLFLELAGTTTLTEAQYVTNIQAMLRGDMERSARVLQRYPAQREGTPWKTFATVLGDFALRCAGRRTLRAMLPHLPRAYVYQFEYANAPFQLPSVNPLGAFHSAEVQFVFGHPSRIGQARFMGNELTLQTTMQDYWTRFATTGNPNGGMLVEWPVQSMTDDAHLVLNTMPTTGRNTFEETCAFWESLGIYP